MTTSTEPAEQLTELELLAVAWAAEGLTNAAIGHRLGLTEDGVKSRLARATRRLSLRNRCHLVAHCLRHNLLPEVTPDVQSR